MRIWETKITNRESYEFFLKLLNNGLPGFQRHMALYLEVYSLLFSFLIESVSGKSAQSKLSYIVSPVTLGDEFDCKALSRK